MPINIAIVDDHPLAISGIVSMLANYPQIRIMDSYTTGRALIDGLLLRQPDIILLDLVLPDIRGKELTAIIHGAYPAIGIIALTILDAPALVRTLLQKGCLGYLLKDITEANLVEAIECVHQGNQYIEAALKERLWQHLTLYKRALSERSTVISSRELEVLQLIVQEYTTQEIADKLCISFRTVENHRTSLLQKLEVKNTAGLVREALLRNLLLPN